MECWTEVRRQRVTPELISRQIVPLARLADDWIALDNDLWVATVIEGERDRLWVKTDIQEPTPAPSTDTRSLYAYAGSDFMVIIIGDPVPEAITVNWDDGSNETVEPTWNTELDMGFARFDNNESQVLSVEPLDQHRVCRRGISRDSTDGRAESDGGESTSSTRMPTPSRKCRYALVGPEGVASAELLIGAMSERGFT